ncbi:MAG: hypothetical protein IPH76_18980 [Xanthomonadales bacterium]|nr:hypothetical protein [Xanthomonadales bacterium]
MMRDSKYDGAKYAAFRTDGSPCSRHRCRSISATASHGRHFPKTGSAPSKLPYRVIALSMQLILPMRADGLAASQRCR